MPPIMKDMKHEPTLEVPAPLAAEALASVARGLDALWIGRGASKNTLLSCCSDLSLLRVLAVVARCFIRPRGWADAVPFLGKRRLIRRQAFGTPM